MSPECVRRSSLFVLMYLLYGTFATAAEQERASAAPDLTSTVDTGAVPDLTKTIDFERTGQYHLGPSGAKGWMYVTKNFMTGDARQILITEVKQGSAADGVLEVTPKSPRAMLAVTGLKCGGPAMVKLRVKGDGGAGSIQWRTSTQPKFPASQRVAFDLPISGEFVDVEVKLPVEGSMIHTRLYLSPRSESAKIDQIQICRSDGTVLKTWEFD